MMYWKILSFSSQFAHGLPCSTGGGSSRITNTLRQAWFRSIFRIFFKLLERHLQYLQVWPYLSKGHVVIWILFKLKSHLSNLVVNRRMQVVKKRCCRLLWNLNSDCWSILRSNAWAQCNPNGSIDRNVQVAHFLGRTCSPPSLMKVNRMGLHRGSFLRDFSDKRILCVSWLREE
jgi:hypothetical protein